MTTDVSLERLDLVLDAWRSQISESSVFHLVADSSLRKELSKQDRKRVGELRRARLFQYSRRDADELILDYAEEHGGCVLSRDRFLDHRRRRAWRPERHFSWSVNDREVRIVRRQSRNTRSFDVSRKEEQRLARVRGLTLDHPMTRRRWACDSDAPCLTRDTSPEELRTLPLLESETALCPGCREPLRDLGPRRSEAELKLLVDGKPVARFTLRQGETVIFGRLRLPNTARMAELARGGAFADLGREHACLRMSGRRIAVRPLDNRHCVRIYPWNSQRRRFDRSYEVPCEEGFTPVGIRDVMQVGKRLELVRSGRSIAEAEALPRTDAVASWQGRVTTDRP
ncbi:MAG TPA: hypothetical protein VF245_09435 [Solirubrobacterales bacterium]